VHPTREESSNRCEERPIGGAKPRVLTLTSEERELVPKQIVVAGPAEICPNVRR
jgi:hypothetical protein